MLSERFNPEMTNDQRHHRSNLLLMCHRHHVETNNVALWTVEKMRDLKATHEWRFEEAVARIAESMIRDITEDALVMESTTMKRWAEIMRWAVDPEDLHETIDVMVRPLLARLRKLAPDTGAVLQIVVERGEDYADDLALRTHELEQVRGMGPAKVSGHVDTMSRYGIASLYDDLEGRIWVVTHVVDGWPFWRELKESCAQTGLGVGAFVTDLRFDLMD